MGLCVIHILILESCVYITLRGKKRLFRCKYVRESQEREIILNYLGGSEGITRVFTRGRLEEGRRVRVRGGVEGRGTEEKKERGLKLLLQSGHDVGFLLHTLI